MKKFEMAEIEVSKFDIADILTTSSTDTTEDLGPIPTQENDLGWI